MDRRRRRMEKTKAALLDSAMKLFSERGIYLTRVEDITEGADVAKGSFYNYFASKDVLVAEILAEAILVLEERYLKALPEVGAVPFRLTALTAAHQAFVEDFPEYALVLHQARGLLQLRSGASERLQQVVLEYLECLARHLPLPSGAELAPRARLQLSTLLAGLVAGPRSFALAADVPYDQALTRDVTCRGLAAILDETPSISPSGPDDRPVRA